MNGNTPRILGALLLAGAIGLAFLHRERPDVAALGSWVSGARVAGPLLFMGVYAAVTVLFIPGSVLTLAGGALFGPLWGTLYNLIGATLGAALAFLVARYLAADWVQSRTKGALGRLLQGVEVEGWRFVAFTRLVPLFPFNLLNYALGLTRIPFVHYLVASLIFMLPGALVYTYLGFAGREAVTGGEGLINKGLSALALVAALVFLPRLVGRLRQGPTMSIQDLKARLAEGEGGPGSGILLLDVRTAADFLGEQGHIREALNLPLEDLGAGLAEPCSPLGEDLERPIALICRTDRRSAKAAALLTRKGFARVSVVQGGMTAWLAQRWPVERARPHSNPTGARP